MRRGVVGLVWWGLVLPRHARRLGGELGGAVFVLGRVHAVAFGRLLLQPGLDDVALLLADRQTTLELLFHDRILRYETRRKTSQAHLLNGETVPGRHRAGRAGSARGGHCSLRKV